MLLIIIINILIPRSKNENSSVLSCLNVPAQHHSEASAFIMQGICAVGKEYYYGCSFLGLNFIPLLQCFSVKSAQSDRLVTMWNIAHKSPLRFFLTLFSLWGFFRLPLPFPWVPRSCRSSRASQSSSTGTKSSHNFLKSSKEKLYRNNVAFAFFLTSVDILWLLSLCYFL